MKSKHGNTKAPFSPKSLESSLALVLKASQPFADSPRLTPQERQYDVRFRRGGHSIIPMIASLAKKHGVVVPGHSLDEMISSIEQAQALEPLLGAVTVLYETLRDQHMIHNAFAWKTAATAYAMLVAGSNASVDVARELEPVKEWFAHRTRSSKKASAQKAAPNGERTTAAAPSESTGSASGAEPTSNGASVNGIGAAHAPS